MSSAGSVSRSGQVQEDLLPNVAGLFVNTPISQPYETPHFSTSVEFKSHFDVPAPFVVKLLYIAKMILNTLFVLAVKGSSVSYAWSWRKTTCVQSQLLQNRLQFLYGVYINLL